MRVIRGGIHICIDGTFYLLHDLTRAADKKLEAAGIKYPGSHRPPFFRSGSPYADALLTLGVSPVTLPNEFVAEHVPHLDKPLPGFEKSDKIWATIFGVPAEWSYDVNMQYK